MCAEPGNTLATVGEDALTCADIDAVTDVVALLASRSVPERQREMVRGEWTTRFKRDAPKTRSDHAAVLALGGALRGASGPAATQARADAVWAALSGEGPLGGADSVTVDVARHVISPWSTDTSTSLVLTEMDIEGWIKYTSLCREVQGGDPLRLSVADRVALYHQVVRQFEGRSRQEQLAILAVGPVWPTLRERWPGVTYEVQQAWVSAAPLPGPMTATSLGYAETLLDSDLVAHATALHGAMGSLPLGVEP